MNINDLTIGQAKELTALFSVSSQKTEAQFEVGKKYFIRTVTNYYVGLCESVSSQSVRLVDASWIPDTGRFSDCLYSSTFNEVEPYPNGVTVWFGGIIDHSVFNGSLPTEKR